MSVRLRPVEDADLPAFFAHQKDPGACRLVGSVPRSREDFDAHWARIRKDPSCVLRAALVDGALAGYLGSFTRDGLREVCYWFGREHWGRGAATEALAAFLAELPERPLWARVARTNPASIRVLEKCGFAAAGESSFVNGAGERLEESLLRLEARP